MLVTEPRPSTANDNPKPKKSGSNKRQRQLQKNFRLSAEEVADFSRRAAESGLSEADYFRVSCLKATPLRKTRRATPDEKAVLLLSVEVNKIGTNINQIAAKLNAGGYASREEIRKAVADVQAMRRAIVKLFERPGNDNNPLTNS